MGEELLVAEDVRAAAADAVPPLDPSLVEVAVNDAVRAHLAGASVAEACELGRDRLARPLEGRPSATQES